MCFQLVLTEDFWGEISLSIFQINDSVIVAMVMFITPVLMTPVADHKRMRRQQQQQQQQRSISSHALLHSVSSARGCRWSFVTGCGKVSPVWGRFCLSTVAGAFANNATSGCGDYFYRAMLCMRVTSYGPVSVCLHCGLRKFLHSKSSVYRWYPQLVRSRFVYDTYRTMEATRSRHAWVHMLHISPL